MTHSEIFIYDSPPAKCPLKGEFAFAVVGLAHGHIFSMCQGLINAGATLKYVYEEDENLLKPFLKSFPNVTVCRSEEEAIQRDDIRLVASAAIPVRRAEIAIKAMESGKDFFVDKAPVISLEQLAAVDSVWQKTGRKYFIYYGESVCNESAVFARSLIQRGVIGEVFHINSTGPHRLNAPTRKDWFFRRENTGGILIDLVCHQIHQYLEFADADDATVDFARTANRFHRQYPGIDDFGDMDCTTTGGITGHFQVDWFTPDGLSTWGDGRTVIQGTDGFIELRKYCDLARPKGGNHVYVVTHDGEFYENVTGKVNSNYYSRIISDCLNRTDTAMNTSRAMKAIEIAIRGQMLAQNK